MDYWRGDPLYTVLTYSVTRKGSKTIVGGPEIKVTMEPDYTFYRIKGLETNWGLTITLHGETAAGAGVKSRPVVGGKDLVNHSSVYCRNRGLF